ncbi:MAG: long-chain acyl-CoA synthetase [Acidimicrobiia bacterium]
MTDTLTAFAELNPDAPAVVVEPSVGGRASTTTYADLNRLANRLANSLLDAGAQPGERLVWCGPNSLEVVTTLHAARKAGLVSVPLSYRFTAEEMRYVVDNSDATTVVIDAEQAPLLASVRDRLAKVERVVVHGQPVPEGCLDYSALVDAGSEAEPTAGETATGFGGSMIYTSGTTGNPKGALRTTSDVDTVVALLEALRFRVGDEVYLTTGPLYHSGPLMFATIMHSLGGSMVTMRRFDPSAWLRAVAEHRATNTFTAPTQLKRIVSLPPDELARADMSSMRILVANAAPVPYALKQEVIEKLGDGFLFEIYGSTELGVATVLAPEEQLRKPGSCGRPYGPIELRIVRDDGTEAPTGEPGELFIRTRLGIDGYHRTEERLAELDEGDWKSVGDVAYLDDEGYLFICDRKKDMIISGGVNIYPAEIEAALHHHPQVLDVAVLGVPDDEWGEAVHAIVQPRPGEVIDLHELDAFVGERLASYKRPRTYEVRDALPRTESGKLLKRVLRDELWRDRDQKV